jgi:hypothetical protein
MSIKDFTPARLQNVTAFRRSYALCDISANNKKLIVTHIAICLLGGNRPTWGIFYFDTGRLMGTAGSMQAIKEHRWYKKKVWRVMQASTVIQRVEKPQDHAERISALEKQVDRQARSYPTINVPEDSPLRTGAAAGNA